MQRCDVLTLLYVCAALRNATAQRHNTTTQPHNDTATQLHNSTTTQHHNMTQHDATTPQQHNTTTTQHPLCNTPTVQHVAVRPIAAPPPFPCPRCTFLHAAHRGSGRAALRSRGGSGSGRSPPCSHNHRPCKERPAHTRRCLRGGGHIQTHSDTQGYTETHSDP